MSSTPSTPRPYIVDGKTDAERYLTDIYDGKIIASKYMRRLSEMMLPRFHEEWHGYHFDVDRSLRVCRFVEQFCVIPEGSKMGRPFILEPFQRNALQLAYGFVDEYGLREYRQVLMEIARKNGKGVQLSEELPTPSGWRKMGDLHVGDIVFGQDGKPSTIIAESEIFDKPTYIITFEDGASFKVTDDHIWTVQTKRSRRAVTPRYREQHPKTSGKYRDGGWYEITTQEMFDDPAFVYHRKDGTGVEYKYRVPMCLPVEYPEKDLPIDPYTFGYWIGDGDEDSTHITVSKADTDEVISILTSLGHRCDIKGYEDRATRILIDGGEKCHRGSNDLKNALRDLGVLNNKHIPDIYLQGSIEQRWELLRGLMDTDGYCSKAGQCQFTQKSKELTEQLVELCSSLGIKANMRSKEARCNGKPAGTVYVVEFWTDKEHSCFHFKRKHDRLKDKLADRMRCKSIVSIERIPNEPSKCIAIDNPSHLYLVGRHYTATHNTSLMSAICLYHLTSDGELGAEVYNCAKNEQQARKCYGSADAMRLKSPYLKDRIRRGMAQKSGKSALNYDKTGSMLLALSGKASTKDGLSASAVIYDELSSVEDNGALFEQLEESTGARRQPMTWIISSENTITVDGIWDERLKYCRGILDGTIHDDTVLPLLYTQDDKREVLEGLEAAENGDSPLIWLKSNPGLFIIKDENKLIQRVRQASQSPRRMPSVLTKEFCLKSGSYSAFLDIDACINETPVDFDEIGLPPYVCVGFDLAARNDLCSCVIRWMVPGDSNIYEMAKFWVASNMLNMQTDDNQKDRVPYLLWSSQGQPMNGTIWHWVDIVEGDRIGFDCVLDFLNDIVSEGIYPYCVGYDPWHIGDLEEKHLQRLIGDTRCFPVPQTARVISPLMREHELDLIAHKVICQNPCLHHSRTSVQARTDNNNNIFPQKKDLQPHQKIDGFMAELFSLAAFNRYRDEYLAAIGWIPPERNSDE